ncbi:MAG: response regulator [Planctomycetota bacterium]|jgi:signal transduction histidine kinase
MAESLRILAVEDDVGDGEILRLNLDDVADWEVDFQRVASSQEALLAIAERDTDAVFVDYNLGAENGIDVLKALRRSGYQGPLVFLTGMGDEQVAVDAFHGGADDYLPKGSLCSSGLQRAVTNAIIKCSLQAELKEQREKLEAANRELKRRNSEIQRFHQLLSHELKTPLTSALSFLEILADGISGPVTETQKEHLQIVKESCGQIVTCIDDLLDVARIESGKLSLDKKPEWVSELLQGTVNAMKPTAQSKGIELSAVVAPNLPQVIADNPRIKQVLNNLLNNALKFTSEGGRVDVMANLSPEDPEMVQISVMDTGCGIELDQIERIFDRLYQSRESDSSEHGGLGLGLNLCKELVSLHDGRIWVVSKPGEGATFTFTLPSHQGVPCNSRVASKKTVLVVEDDKTMATSLAIRLEAAGYSAIQAFDGASGISMAAKERPDLLILDIAMPAGGGFAVAERVRGLIGQGDVPIIFLTASKDKMLRDKAESLGAAAFFEKPCPAEELLGAVRSAI